MLRNQRGDALTLAMGAAVFIGISIMVTIAVLSNLGMKSKRARVLNEIDSVVLSIEQVLGNRDLCVFALKTSAAAPIVIPSIPNPPSATTTTVDIPRFYLMDNPLGGGTTPDPLYCVTPAGQPVPANCRTSPHFFISSMQWIHQNSPDINNRSIRWNGVDNRYRVYSGVLRVTFRFGDPTVDPSSIAARSNLVFGGDIRARDIPLQMIVDPTGPPAGNIELCYTRESPAQICAGLGGSLNQITGACENMFGQCGVDIPASGACAGMDSTRSCTLGLVRSTFYYAQRVEPNYHMDCACHVACVPP